MFINVDVVVVVCIRCTNISKNKAEKYSEYLYYYYKFKIIFSIFYDCRFRAGAYETACACVKTATVVCLPINYNDHNIWFNIILLC